MVWFVWSDKIKNCFGKNCKTWDNEQHGDTQDTSTKEWDRVTGEQTCQIQPSDRRNGETGEMERQEKCFLKIGFKKMTMLTFVPFPMKSWPLLLHKIARLPSMWLLCQQMSQPETRTNHMVKSHFMQQWISFLFLINVTQKLCRLTANPKAPGLCKMIDKTAKKCKEVLKHFMSNVDTIVLIFKKFEFVTRIIDSCNFTCILQ